MYETSAMAKKAGNHSRRNKTRELQDNERANWQDRVVKRREDAVMRDVERSHRSDNEQLRSLVARGHGECKEANRLRKRMCETVAEAEAEAD